MTVSQQYPLVAWRLLNASEGCSAHRAVPRIGIGIATPSDSLRFKHIILASDQLLVYRSFLSIWTVWYTHEEDGKVTTSH